MNLLSFDEVSEIYYRYAMCFYNYSQSIPYSSEHISAIDRCYDLLAVLACRQGELSEKARILIDTISDVMIDKATHYIMNASTYLTKDNGTLKLAVKVKINSIHFFLICKTIHFLGRKKHNLITQAQSFFVIGAFFCTEMHERTKQDKYIDKACEFLEFALREELTTQIISCIKQLVTIMIHNQKPIKIQKIL